MAWHLTCAHLFTGITEVGELNEVIQSLTYNSLAPGETSWDPVLPFRHRRHLTSVATRFPLLWPSLVLRTALRFQHVNTLTPPSQQTHEAHLSFDHVPL